MSSNVFIDEFTGTIPQHRVPLADEAQVTRALARVDAVLSSYYDSLSNEPLVNIDWIQDNISEFGDWLCSRIPVSNEARITRKYPNSVILHDYVALCVQEYIDESTAYLAPRAIPNGAAILATGMCESVTLTTSGFHVVVDMPDMEEPYELDFPPCSEDDLEMLQKIEVNPAFDVSMLSNKAAYRVLLRQALFFSILECMTHEYATIAVVANNDDPTIRPASTLVGAFVFCNGRFATLDDRDVRVLVGRMNEDVPSAGFALEINANYESLVAEIANSLSRSVKVGMISESFTAGTMEFDIGVVTYPTLVDVSGGDPSELFTDDVETQSVVLGNGLAIVPSDLVADEPLPRVFESIHAITLGGATAEACSATMAICALRSAMMLVEDGGFDRVGEMVEEFADFIELSRERFDIPEGIVAPIFEYARNCEARRHDTMLLDVYDGMSDNMKDEIDAIIEGVESRHSYVRKVVALGASDEAVPAVGDGHVPSWEEQMFGGVPLSAHVMIFPSFVDDDAEVLKAFCMRCVCSPAPTTMFFAFEDERGRVSQLGGVAWENGRWTNLEKNHIEAMISSSNISQILNIDSPDSYEYYSFKHKRND